MKVKHIIGIILIISFAIFMFVEHFYNRRMVSEIIKLKDPVGFNMIDVNSIVEKYIPIDTSKKNAVSFLKDSGFTISDFATDRSEGRYLSCDDALSSFYSIYVFPWPIYAYKIVIRICFIDDEVVFIRAVYLKHNY